MGLVAGTSALDCSGYPVWYSAAEGVLFNDVIAGSVLLSKMGGRVMICLFACMASLH